MRQVSPNFFHIKDKYLFCYIVRQKTLVLTVRLQKFNEVIYVFYEMSWFEIKEKVNDLLDMFECVE